MYISINMNMLLINLTGFRYPAGFPGGRSQKVNLGSVYPKNGIQFKNIKSKCTNELKRFFHNLELFIIILSPSKSIQVQSYLKSIF